MILSEVLQKIEDLRKEWKEKPDKRPIIELKARVLQAALRVYYKNHPQDKLIEPPLDS